MAEDLTPKQIMMQKFIAVVFTLAVFVLLVWLVLNFWPGMEATTTAGQ